MDEAQKQKLQKLLNESLSEEREIQKQSKKWGTEKFDTIGEWYEAAKAIGYSVPLQMCHGMQQLMEKSGLKFYEVYRLFMREKVFFIHNRHYIYDLGKAQEIINGQK